MTSLASQPSEARAVASRGREIVSLHEANVTFGRVQALRGASLAVHAGDAIAIVGANGSGKTTLLRVLHGALAHDGRRDTARDAGVQAMVFQRPFLLRLSVRNNLHVALWLACRSVSGQERRRRADEALHRVGLASLADRPALGLSGGEQQRLALARAWSLRPEILFLDEPTASLDPSAKREVESLLEGFAADGTTLVMSTHNLGQAKRIANRIVFMDRGRIEADLPTGEFFGSGAQGRARLFLKGEMTWSNEG